MKILAVFALGCAAVAASFQDFPEPTQPGAEHAWLQQLVGEWTLRSEATMAPGAEPMVMEATETVRSIGGLWILGEGKASFGGVPFTSLLTLGYDPSQSRFVGTWVDTMQTHMWVYSGQLDAEKRVLTLETEGPSFGDPSKRSSYRDVIEMKGPDLRTLSSSVKGEDGQWNTFVRAEYKRKQ